MFVKNRRARFIQTAVVPLSSLGLIVALTGCSDEEAEPENSANNQNSVNSTNSVPNSTVQRWSYEVIQGGNMGLSPRAAVAANGTLGVAYMSLVGRNDGDCVELGDMPPPQVRWTLRYAENAGSGWTAETVAEPRYVGSPPGIDLQFDGSTAVIAGMIGAPSDRFNYCGVNDVGLYSRASAGNWTTETAVAESNEAPVGDPASDFGTVVGYWPALAIASNGDRAVAYKDVHSGGLQSDDFRKADLEMALSPNGGGWSAVAVNPTLGGGDFNEMIFDDQNRPIIVEYIGTEDAQAGNLTGIWVHRSSDNGATWESAQIHNQPSPDGPSITIDSVTGDIHVGYYNGGRGFPMMATLTDPDNFESVADSWEIEDLGDSRYDEGYGSSIVARDGIIGLAYYRCTKAIDGLGECNQGDDALVFAYKIGGSWDYEVVDPGESGLCGNAPSLVFDADGRPGIAYRCEVFDGSVLDTEVRFARRSSAP